MPLYESVYIARPDISATQVETLTADMTKILEENGGKVTKDEYWGLKSLAYRIKKNRKGHYSLMNIDAPAAALTEMERNMRLHEDVLRYMSIRVDEHEEEPSVMMQSKSSRDDRDRDRGRGRDDDRPKPAAAETPAAAPAATEESAPAADNKETEV
ncbi:MAG: 30S ribosomal protein S6 [Rhodospirillaceae bacterium]|nr:30S ribosomal protein S6 [Rhodospirillaceae bacterium]